MYLPLPTLPTSTQSSSSIQIGSNGNGLLSGDDESDLTVLGGKWEDEEERRFFEDIQDLREVVPKSILGVEDDKDDDQDQEKAVEDAEERRRAEEEEVKKLEEELAGLEVDGNKLNGDAHSAVPGEDANAEEDNDDGCDPT